MGESSAFEVIRRYHGEEARRLIMGKGIKIDGETRTDIDYMVSGNIILQRGKNRFVQVSFR